MSRYQPPFTITPRVVTRVAEIGELLGLWSARSGRLSPLLRKENRIRTIHASLAIEHNSLDVRQVTAIMSLSLFIRFPTVMGGWGVCGKP